MKAASNLSATNANSGDSVHKTSNMIYAITGSSNISESNGKSSKEIDGPPNLNLPTTRANSVDAFDKNCNNESNGDAKHDIMGALVGTQSSSMHAKVRLGCLQH